MKIEKESDALYREYRQLARLIYQLTRKHNYDDPLLWIRINEIYTRQGQIIAELEKCTGIELIFPSVEAAFKLLDKIIGNEKS